MQHPCVVRAENQQCGAQSESECTRIGRQEWGNDELRDGEQPGQRPALQDAEEIVADRSWVEQFPGGGQACTAPQPHESDRYGESHQGEHYQATLPGGHAAVQQTRDGKR